MNRERVEGQFHGDKGDIPAPYYRVHRLPIDGLYVEGIEPQTQPLPRQGTIFEIGKRAMRRITRSGK